MRLTLNQLATEQLLELMQLNGFTNPTHAINRLVTDMYHATKNRPANPSREVINDQQQHQRNPDQ